MLNLHLMLLAGSRIVEFVRVRDRDIGQTLVSGFATLPIAAFTEHFNAPRPLYWCRVGAMFIHGSERENVGLGYQGLKPLIRVALIEVLRIINIQRQNPCLLVAILEMTDRGNTPDNLFDYCYGGQLIQVYSHFHRPIRKDLISYFRPLLFWKYTPSSGLLRIRKYF